MLSDIDIGPCPVPLTHYGGRLVVKVSRVCVF